MCCNVLQCVAVCCRLASRQKWTVSISRHAVKRMSCSELQCVAVCCRELQCVAVCCSVLQCVAVCCRLVSRQKTYVVSIRYAVEKVCCSVVQCVAMGCVLQCVAGKYITHIRTYIRTHTYLDVRTSEDMCLLYAYTCAHSIRTHVLTLYVHM